MLEVDRGTTAVELLAGPAVLLSTGAVPDVLTDVADPELLEATGLLLPQPAPTSAQARARATTTHR